MITLFKKHQRLLLFLTVGFFTALINFSVFTMAWARFGINYKIAVTLAYFTAVIFQFLANRHVTFKSQNNNVTAQIIKFVIVLIINYFISLGVVTSAVNFLNMPPYIGMVLSIGVTVFSGFFFSKKWIYI